jgi:hypothetical protein
MSRTSLPPRPGRLRRAAAGLAVALAVPLTMAVSCEPGTDQEDQQEQQEDQEDGGGGEQEDDGDD